MPCDCFGGRGGGAGLATPAPPPPPTPPLLPLGSGTETTVLFCYFGVNFVEPRTLRLSMSSEADNNVLPDMRKFQVVFTVT